MEFFNSAVDTLQTIVVAWAGRSVCGAASICWRDTEPTTPPAMLMCGKVTHKNLIDSLHYSEKLTKKKQN